MSETDRRLKDQLNGNQPMRERMCLEVLLVTDDYLDIKPRLPKGGPDGGRDIQGYFRGKLFYGAVGFVNDATDTNEHRNSVERKFKSDFQNAIKNNADQKIKSFVFLTNVGLTPSKISLLKGYAHQQGIDSCEIFDRERLRISLDSNKGYAIRYRYLDIPLNDAEQKDFFSAWTDRINDMVADKLNVIDKTARRIQFLLESQGFIDHLGTVVKFNDSIWACCKGEYFFQTRIFFRAQVDGFMGITYGGGTTQIVESLDEWEKSGKGFPRNSQYGFSFSSVISGTTQSEWFDRNQEKAERPKKSNAGDTGDQSEKLNGSTADYKTQSSNSVLEVEKDFLHFKAMSEPFIFRYSPACKLIDLDRCMIIFDCSEEIANCIDTIEIYGDGYSLCLFSKEDFTIEPGKYNRLTVPQEAKHKPESHNWVTLRPSRMSSFFTIDLFRSTPRRYDW